MEMIRLGRSGVQVSRLGLGGCPLGGHGWGSVDDAESIRAIRAALHCGIRFFDTADVYGLGHSEEILARGLGEDRHRVEIASKFGLRWDEQRVIRRDASPAYLRQALHRSLRRLRVDCLSVYYLHWPDPRTPIMETVGALERCREEGKIRAIGMCNLDRPQWLQAEAAGEIACLQTQYSLVDRSAERLAAEVTAGGSTVVTWGSLAQGLLTGKFSASATFGQDDRRGRYDNFQGQRFSDNLRVVEYLRTVARGYGRNPAQVALRWLLETPQVGCVLFGAKSASQVEQNVGACGWRMRPSDYGHLASAGLRAAA